MSLGLAGGMLAAGGSSAVAELTLSDPVGDAAPRFTDDGADGVITSGSLPDLIGTVVRPWQPLDPLADPYTGTEVDPEDAHLFRLDLVFRGRVNPPGPLGAFDDHDPLRFGDSPLYGYLDIDVDGPDTGGELDGAGRFRYLANAARFGALPSFPIAGRVARSGGDLDSDFSTPPQYERTGADFALVFCGCWDLQIVVENGDGDGIFDAGESWIVEGRFFERTRGYRDASAAFFGSAEGLYDPITPVRFSHGAATNLTTVSLVFPLDQAGSAMLRGEAEEPVDLDVSNQVSVAEALADIIDGARGLHGPVKVLTELWDGRDPSAFLDPYAWRFTALFGTAYLDDLESSLFVWTDTGFNSRFADVNGSGGVGSQDEALVSGVIYALDGGAADEDGVQNGLVDLIGFGPNFSLYDLTNDGAIDIEDLAVYGPLADMNGDGVVTGHDFVLFLVAFSAGELIADINHDRIVNSADFTLYLIEFSS